VKKASAGAEEAGGVIEPVAFLSCREDVKLYSVKEKG